MSQTTNINSRMSNKIHLVKLQQKKVVWSVRSFWKPLSPPRFNLYSSMSRCFPYFLFFLLFLLWFLFSFLYLVSRLPLLLVVFCLSYTVVAVPASHALFIAAHYYTSLTSLCCFSIRLLPLSSCSRLFFSLLSRTTPSI